MALGPQVPPIQRFDCRFGCFSVTVSLPYYYYFDDDDDDYYHYFYYFYYIYYYATFQTSEGSNGVLVSGIVSEQWCSLQGSANLLPSLASP